MKQLVVNADDFGMSEWINEGILESHLRGIVTSTTLLANGDAFEAAVAIAKTTPKLGVGVHLSLTQGRPVSDPYRIPSLTNRDGNLFRGPGGLLRSAMAGKLRRDEIEREFDAQIEKVRAAGISISHLDSHKHVHMLPGIFPIVVRLAQSKGIASLRVASERNGRIFSVWRRNIRASAKIAKQFVRSRGLATVSRNSAMLARLARLHFPSHFYGVTQTGFLGSRELSELLLKIPEGTSELMCHPGRFDSDADPSLTRLRESRQRELEALTSPETRELVERLGINLISYRELGPA
jgi:predicted glycoside hydrolase/deacetylase ChbG (UPF0249 family)